ncbi:hypothetical protein OCHUTO_0271 [Orientia chuto str. Dubai]|uniref:Uncharacterized protein n=1 Tax=Orientia chuto str. Dubai TaxID=1359168 RepID=A0A0F3MQL3_9RICK|nr:hypothetical protein [Candidatus Orientia mediorientalis]KJV56894.1 hypothetical protein OCHUTO_0271 [Orientia chuto str. Dubai]
MRRIYLIFITSIVILLLLLISWYAIWKIFANQITKTYGKQDIIVYQQDGSRTTISFSNVTAATTPFSVGFNVSDVTISSISEIIRCTEPIKIKYSLISKILLIEYKGQCYRYTQESNFNNNIIKIDATISSKLTLSKRLFQIVTKHNLFELINYINDFKFSVREFSDYDNVKNLLKNKVLESHFHFSFDNHPYYYNVNDFENDIPKKYTVDSKITVDYMNYSSTHRSFEFTSTLHFLLPKVSWSSIIKNIEQNSFNGRLNIEKLSYEDNKLAVTSKLDYQNLAHRENKDNKLATSYFITIKDKLYFAKILLASILSIAETKKSNFDLTVLLQGIANFDYRTALQNIVLTYADNNRFPEKKYLTKLDFFDNIINTINLPKQITFDLDFELSFNRKSNIFRLNVLKILLNNFGINIKDFLYDTTNPKFITNFYISDFKDLIDFIIDFYNIKTIIENQFQADNQKIDDSILQENQSFTALSKDILKSFLSKISKPLHSSPNIRAINCQYISNKIRISNLDLLAIRKLYYKTLYNQVRKIVDQSITPNILILKVLPQLQKKTNLIDKINRSPEIITQELWMEILGTLLESDNIKQ